ncbi:hypothetical protein [Streptomyces turgidiscabies]|nr:hypothetical protein [Streptomyces turgidiscabies]
MTIEGIDEDDACTGTCCTEPRRRPGLLARIRAVLRGRLTRRRDVAS